MAEASIQMGKTVIIITCTKETKEDYQQKLFEMLKEFEAEKKGMSE